MKIFLLTHERELTRTTNTGSIAIENGNGVVERIFWQRTSPSKELTGLIDACNSLLLYPTESNDSESIEDYENIIILDGTWQEAAKIFNKSEYLKNMPRASIKSTAESKYKLRRNQKTDGFCTIECVIEVLRIKGLTKLASQLEIEFEMFNRLSNLV